MPDIPLVTLNDGNSIPRLGLGLWRVGDDEAASIVREAVAAGYRLLDTATRYGNETGVGRGVRESGVPREELFVTTKVWNDRHGRDQTLAAFDDSMAMLGLDYVDLYLIHWPVAGSDKYLETWKTLVELRAAGRTRSIGVSNFLPVHLERLVGETGVVPALNQIEYHPYFRQDETVACDSRLGIATQCWAPIGRGKAFGEPAVVSLAEKYGKTPAQIVLRWHLEQGRLVIPKTANPLRMRENAAVFDFALLPGEIAALDAIAGIDRIGGDPMTFVDIGKTLQ